MLFILLACTSIACTGGSSNTPGGQHGDTAVGDGGGDGGDGGGSQGDGGGLADGGGEAGDSASDGGGAIKTPGDVTLALDPDVVTVVRATWTDEGADASTVQYRFDGGKWQTAPAVEAGSAVLLGIPAETEVEARLAEMFDGVEYTGDSSTIVTGSLPSDLLVPSIDAWDASLADVAPYAMISVTSGSYTYGGPYWIEIFDRAGHIVWYKQVPDGMFDFYPSVARDGTHIWYDAENIFGFGTDTAHLVRQTLDGRWLLRIDVPDMGQAVGEGPDNTFYYERRTGDQAALAQVDAGGHTTTIWDCAAWMAAHGQAAYMCEMNTTNWSESHNTVLTSMFYANTVFEIDLSTGEPIRQMGQFTSGDPYTFSPAESMFAYQHFPNWTADGTLLVSTHVRGVSGTQVAAEYTVDDDTKTLTRIWSYVSTDMWATQVGEALRLRNGNTVQGYGQDGAVREVTTDGQIAWQASWEKDSSGYRVVGHFTLIDDLYALNRGPADGP